MQGMVIIGAGECGARAALALREQGFDGPVTLIGEEVHLPYERPPLSKEVMTCEGVPVARTIADAGRLADNRIQFAGGSRVDAIDPTAKSLSLSNGRVVAYDKLLIATGSKPRRLPMAEGLPNVAYLRSFDDALAIRSRFGAGKKVAIIGGGFIGLELAASARRRGAEVTVVEAKPRILMRGVPAEIAAEVHALHRSHGVEIFCGSGIAGIDSDGHGVRTRLDNGQLIETDFAVIGIGTQPETALAEKAGLAVENGIAVDRYLQSSNADIFAAGDCCSFPLSIAGGRRVRLEAWRNAQEQGVVAAANMLGQRVPHSAMPWFWSDQYEASLYVTGLADEACMTVRRDLEDGSFILFHLSLDGHLVAASGIGKGNTVARDIRLAEMLIARRAKPDVSELASPQTKLKKLLAA